MVGRYLMVMHDDTTESEDGAAWGPYLERLSADGRLAGGSSLAPAVAHRHIGDAAPDTGVVGYLLVEASDAADAASLLAGNPTFEAGGTVHIHELIED